jgi:hypothetical protein
MSTNNDKIAEALSIDWQNAGIREGDMLLLHSNIGRTLRRIAKLGGKLDPNIVDSTFSMEPTEMAALVIESERAWQALGKVNYRPTEKEKKSLEHRHSIYIVKDMKAGEKLTCENLRAIRPGFGLPPKYLEILLGRSLAKDVKKGTAISWDLLR